MWRRTLLWQMNIRIAGEETCCRHYLGYSFRLAARVLLYAPSHRQDRSEANRGALATTRNSSMGQLHEGSIRRAIAPRANALTTELHIAPIIKLRF